ncbi:MAG: hypothetical protein QW764_01495 [Desulfurococcaceae archaeon]
MATLGSLFRFLAVYELLGSKSMERTLCFLLKHFKANTVILLGNTTSPSAIYWLSKVCGATILGVLGELDNPAVSQALKAVNGLLDCRGATVHGLKLFGYGVGTCSSTCTIADSIDVLVTSQPGFIRSCCKLGNDNVDHLHDLLRPKLLLAGGCRYPCMRDGIYSPGSLRLGYFGVLSVDPSKGVYEFTVYQLDKYFKKTAALQIS